MNEMKKEALLARALVVSTIILFIMSFIDIQQGAGMFNFSNPLTDEDWIITLISVFAFAVSLRYTLKKVKKS